MKSPARPQRGAALFISLVMLVVITLFVLSAINMSTVNLRVTANSQARSEGIAAAQQAIEQVISKDFTSNPQEASIPVSLRVDQTKTDYTVAIPKPTCVNAMPVTQAELATRDDSARTHVYRARLTREQTQRQLVSDLMNRAFGGSATALVMQALSTHAASADELAEIQQLIDAYRKESNR